MAPHHDNVWRVSERLELIGVAEQEVVWQNEREHGYLEVGLDPYSDDMGRRMQVLCDPIEVRFIEDLTVPVGRSSTGRAVDRCS